MWFNLDGVALLQVSLLSPTSSSYWTFIEIHTVLKYKRNVRLRPYLELQANFYLSVLIISFDFGDQFNRANVMIIEPVTELTILIEF